MGRTFGVVLLSAFIVGAPLSLRGQTQADPGLLKFEIASVKPNTSDAPGIGGLGFAPNGIRARNASPATLLWMAFDVQPDQIVDTPSWATNERFDINANISSGHIFNPTTMFAPMLLNLLVDRFRLETHHETRALDVYRLVRVRADRLGPKLAPAAIDACAPPAQTDVASLRAAAKRCSGGPSRGGISVHGMPLAALAKFMGPSAGRVIVDATGLTGNWDLDLAFVNPVENPGSDGPSLFTALQEQLGLKLEAARSPVDVIVIDHLERPTPD